MTHAADIAALVEEVKELLQQLLALLPEQTGDASQGTTTHHKVSGSPAPWHPEAGMVLLTIHEEARRLEASLRGLVVGHPGRRRGGSDANTVEALNAIANLVHGVPPAAANRAARIIERWLRAGRQIGDIGEEEPWVPIPVPYGALPPLCPYCQTFSLRMLVLARQVRCVNRACRDRDGRPPEGRLENSRLNGDPQISWADGRVTYRRDWA
ncbi:hypothetical protein Aple_010530 [Acrocarpospora pleiomorpha]|uniref:Uncharacterized protein n=1 Tax=Acrocarpospora pleiomorpha TaxID=90975 RepID=A0A5M3XJB7_9ACTN|nr:hypothetical protein [Acrocarpospora pleiomorpha]GES18158.1 hypothetical protein Aple_010530 [Acrocarpospora pleiomorpha]